MPSLYAYTSTASAPLVEHEYKNFDDEGIDELSISLMVFLYNFSCFESTKKFFLDKKNINKLQKILYLLPEHGL